MSEPKKLDGALFSIGSFVMTTSAHAQTYTDQPVIEP